MSSTYARLTDELDVGVAQAEFFLQLPTRSVVVRLTRGHDAARGDVPPTGPDVLTEAAAMDQQPTIGRHHGNADRTMLQPASPHLGTRDGGDHVVVVVDDVDQFLHHRLRSTIRRMDLDNLRDGAHDLLSDMVSLRRTLHQWPEIGNDLPITRDTVLGALDGLPLDVTLHESTSGIAALLDGGKPGPTVLLRGDMDALPLTEATDLDFQSRNDSTMHACGHDTHTSMLVGAARLLSTQRADIAGQGALHVPAG